jgi:hypothetical protein
MNFMQNFNMNQYSRLDAKKQRRIEHTNKRHPAIANGIWLSRELSNKNDCDGETFEKTSPIFHGYNITRRLQKKGPSIPAVGREILEKLMFKETGQTKDVYVKVPPYGAGKFVEGRVWDPNNGVHVTLGDNNGDVGGKKPGLKGLGRPQNQVCDEYIVHLDWGNDGQGKDLKLATQRKYESGILHVKPDQVQFHVPGRPRMLRDEKIKRGNEAMVSANGLWKKEWQTSPPPDVDGKKVYLASVFEAVKQYQVGIDFLHGYTVKSKFPSQGALNWGEPYASKRNALLGEINLNLAICANILGKDNIEKATSISIFASNEVIDKYCKPTGKDDINLFQAYRGIEKYHRSLKANIKKINCVTTSPSNDNISEGGKGASADDFKDTNNVKKSLKLLQTFINDLNNFILEKDGNDTTVLNLPDELTALIGDEKIVQHITNIVKTVPHKLKNSMKRIQQIDDARLQKAIAIVERNHSGDSKEAKSELSALWAVKGSLLYNEKRVALLKQLRVNIKERRQRDQKQRAKLGKKLRKATKTGKRFGDDTREKDALSAANGAVKTDSVTSSPLQNVLPPTFLGGVGSPAPANNNKSNNNIKKKAAALNKSAPKDKINKKAKTSRNKKKKNKKHKSDDLSIGDYIGYGAIAVGVAALVSIILLRK